MAASDVYSALNDAINGDDKSIDLWQAAQGSASLAALRPVLALFGITQSWTLNNATLSGDNSRVLMTASGRFGVPGGTPDGVYTVAATLTYVSGALFSLNLRVVDSKPWTFAAFFPTLPASERATVDQRGILGIRWTTSYLIGSKPAYAVVVKSVSFSA
ncbi:hypothetical protein DBR33_04315, partial [Stenotrophomonas sp. HMWF022]